MLRYWFRTFALGVLSPQKVQEWEAKLFGAIKPTRAIGWLKVEVLKGKTVRREPAKNNENCGLQEGVLVLALSAETSYHKEQQDTIKSMAENLVWLMFNLGGIGQGARRPCYSRQNRQYRPWYRGSTFIIDSQDDFWEQPEDLSSFGRLFQKRLVNFYKYLAKLTETAIDYKHPKTVGSVNTGQWNEAVDANCRIVLCKGKPNQNKVYALEVLHSQQFKINNNYDGNLCGKVAHGVKPSPVWITDLEDYQVVTIFGATANPRQDYLKVLKQKGNCQQIFPFSQT